MNDISAGFIVLHGPNGAGKTNILEAISLLTPGRGLRRARMADIQCVHNRAPWAVSAKVQMGYTEVPVGTGIDPRTEKRTVRINGETAKNQNALSEYLSCVWLTPQMDRLFLEGSTERRRFLDRLIAAFDRAHLGRLTRYQNALRQRSKLLKEEKNEPVWLDGLENQMAETGMAIAAARLDFVERLQTVSASHEHPLFPHTRLRVHGTLESDLVNTPALELEDGFKAVLKESRSVDMLTGGAAVGPHKSDFVVQYAAKNMPAAQCSTGEQKALLTGIILAHARLIRAEKHQPPVLLLDEVSAHLDDKRRSALYQILTDIGTQTWLTGTGKNLFESLSETAQFFHVRDAQILTT